MRRPLGRKKRECPGEEGEDKKKEEEIFFGGGSKRSNNSENPKQRKIKLVGSIADFLVKCMDSNGQKQALLPYVT